MSERSSGVVLVTGASGGVGKALARRLLDHGYDVLGAALDQADLEQARNDGLAKANWFIADLANGDTAMAQVHSALQSSRGPLVAVIGCAGVSACGPLEATPLSVFRRTMEINTVANLGIYQLSLPYLRMSKGRLIFVSSLAGKVALPLLGYYNASKYALEGLADTMRLEAGQWGIHVALIEPGAIATPMVHGFAAALDARFAELDPQSQRNYRDYFEQHKALSRDSGAVSLMPDEVAEKIVHVLHSDPPDTRYPVGGAVDFFERRKALSDQQMDAVLNQFLPGSRGTTL